MGPTYLASDSGRIDFACSPSRFVRSFTSPRCILCASATQYERKVGCLFHFRVWARACVFRFFLFIYKDMFLASAFGFEDDFRTMTNGLLRLHLNLVADRLCYGLIVGCVPFSSSTYSCATIMGGTYSNKQSSNLCRGHFAGEKFWKVRSLPEPVPVMKQKLNDSNIDLVRRVARRSGTSSAHYRHTITSTFSFDK